VFRLTVCAPAEPHLVILFKPVLSNLNQSWQLNERYVGSVGMPAALPPDCARAGGARLRLRRA